MITVAELGRGQPPGILRSQKDTLQSAQRPLCDLCAQNENFFQCVVFVVGFSLVPRDASYPRKMT